MSDKVRVYEIAEEAGASSTEVIAKAKDLNIDLKSPQSAVSYEDAEEITKYIMTGKSSRLPEKAVSKAKKVIEKKASEVIEEVKETTAEIKKEEIVEKKNVEVPKKPELKKVVISKPISKPATKAQEEFDKPELNPDNASKIVPKRRGLVIVKKNKPKEEEEELFVAKSFDSDSQNKKQMKSLSEILGANDEDEKVSSNNKHAISIENQIKAKAKKDKKKTVVKAQDHGKNLS